MKYKEQTEPVKANKVFKAETLNAERGISSTISLNRAEGKYVVCLSLPRKMIKTVFLSEGEAFRQFRNYRKLYKSKQPQF